VHAQVEVEQEFEELNEQLFHAQQKVHELQQSLTESEAKRCAFCVHGATPPVPPFNCGQAVALALLWLEAIGCVIWIANTLLERRRCLLWSVRDLHPSHPDTLLLIVLQMSCRRQMESAKLLAQAKLRAH